MNRISILAWKNKLSTRVTVVWHYSTYVEDWWFPLRKSGQIVIQQPERIAPGWFAFAYTLVEFCKSRRCSSATRMHPPLQWNKDMLQCVLISITAPTVINRTLFGSKKTAKTNRHRRRTLHESRTAVAMMCSLRKRFFHWNSQPKLGIYYTVRFYIESCELNLQTLPSVLIISENWTWSSVARGRHKSKVSKD